MDRRSILKVLSVSGFVALGSGSVMRQLLQSKGSSDLAAVSPVAEDSAVSVLPDVPQKLADIVEEHAAAADFHEVSAPSRLENKVADLQSDLEAAKADPHVKEYMKKIRYFEGVFDDDYFISRKSSSWLNRLWLVCLGCSVPLVMATLI